MSIRYVTDSRCPPELEDLGEHLVIATLPPSHDMLSHDPTRLLQVRVAQGAQAGVCKIHMQLMLLCGDICEYRQHTLLDKYSLYG